MSAAVVFDVLATSGRHKAGVATLNRPQTLNGLSLQMCELLTQQLNLWQEDDSIALVILNGAGPKAFCAGGDLHGLYGAMQENTGGDPWDNTYARRFFDVEYRLDYQIHTYPKPILCWGSGIVMGGGVGLFMGASHRVVTETTRFAMPEISIGLFPDVGGTWMLSRLPGGTGLFLALTGAQLGASDCRFLGLADHTLLSAHWEQVVEDIKNHGWADEPDANAIALSRILQALKPQSDLPVGPLQTHYLEIRRACDGRDFEHVCANVAAWGDNADPWLARAAATFKAGSPGSARLSFASLQRARLMSLADVFREEYIVSLQCGVQGDFQEGIRALLIDKDKQPKWNPVSIAHASNTWVQRFFQPPWPKGTPHPLADLGGAT